MSKKHGKGKRHYAQNDEQSGQQVTSIAPEASSQNQSAHETNAHTEENSQKESAKEKIFRFFGWWEPNRIMALFTVVIAGIGIAQACIYNQQLDQMRGQLGAMNKQLDETRPWLGIDGDPFDISTNENGTGITFKIRLMNYGQAPVIKVSNTPEFKLIHGHGVDDDTFEQFDICPVTGKSEMFTFGSLRTLKDADFVAPGTGGAIVEEASAEPVEERLSDTSFIAGCLPYMGPNGSYYVRMAYPVSVSVAPNGALSFSVTGRRVISLGDLVWPKKQTEQ